MRLAFLLFKYFPYGGLQRDCARLVIELQQRGHRHKNRHFLLRNTAEHRADVQFTHDDTSAAAVHQQGGWAQAADVKHG